MRTGSAGAGHSASVSPDTGKNSSTKVPRPGRLVIRIVPPDCATSPSTIDSPSPVPRPAPFVVKNGSVARLSVTSSMPCPVSCSAIQT